MELIANVEPRVVRYLDEDQRRNARGEDNGDPAPKGRIPVLRWFRFGGYFDHGKQCSQGQRKSVERSSQAEVRLHVMRGHYLVATVYEDRSSCRASLLLLVGPATSVIESSKGMQTRSPLVGELAHDGDRVEVTSEQSKLQKDDGKHRPHPWR